MKRCRVGGLIVFIFLSLPLVVKGEQLDEIEPYQPIINQEYQEALPYGLTISKGQIENTNEIFSQYVTQKMFPDITKKLTTSSTKLGYLKGDKLTVSLPNSLFSLNRDKPTRFSTVGSNNRDGFTGSVNLTNFTIASLDSSIQVTVNRQQNQDVTVVELERLENRASTGQITFSAQIQIDIVYYFDVTFGLDVVGPYKNSIVAPTFKTSVAPALTVAPKLTANLKEEKRVLTVNEHFDSTDPFRYITVLTSAGTVEASYEEIPSTLTMGETQAVVRLKDEYNQTLSLTVPFRVIDRIIAEVKKQQLLLGTKVSDLLYSDWLTAVKLEQSGVILLPDSYQVTLKNPNQVIKTIDDQEIIVIVTSGEASSEVTIPVSVIAGNSVIVNNVQGESIFALSLLPTQNGTYRLAGSKGRSSFNGVVSSPIDLVMVRPLTMPVTLNELGADRQYSFTSQENLLDSYQKLEPTDVQVGDIVKLTNHDINQIGEPYEVYHDSQKIADSKPVPVNDETIYFVVTEHGFQQLWLNQLSTISGNQLELYQTEAEIVPELNEYIYNGYKDKNVVVQGFARFPSTKMPGVSTGEIRVTQELNGQRFQLNYEIEALITEGELKVDVPQVFEFGSYTLGSSKELIQRNSVDESIKVTDNRLDSEKGEWTLAVQIADDTNPLGKYVVYRDEHGTTYNLQNNQSIPILTSSKGINTGKVTSETNWADDEGILLKIPKHHNLEVASYQTKIDWTIIRGGL